MMKPALLSYAEALERIREYVSPLTPQRLDWRDSLGTTLAEDLYAREAIPGFDNSAMDGYAVRSEDVAAATPDFPVPLAMVGEIFAARENGAMEILSGCAAKITTGAPVPAGADTVVMVEKTKSEGERVLVLHPVKAGENIRRTGDEIRAGDLLLSEGAWIGGVERSMAAQQGILNFLVRKPPRVALLTTGDELVEPEELPSRGQVRNVNVYTLEAALKKMGCPVIHLGIGRDDPLRIRSLVENGLNQAEVLLTTGGVSAGEKDYLPSVLNEMGMKTIFHKVDIKPGKPLLFGLLDGCCVFGLPGNVASSLVTYHLFVKPALRRLAGRKEWRNPSWYVRWGEPMKNTSDRTHFIRCRLTHLPTGLPIAFPTGKQGSGMLSSLAGADGFAVVPSDIDAVEEFTVLEFIPIEE